jgi:hypothetical protein
MSTVRKKSLAIGVAAALSLGGAFALGATAPTHAAPLSVNALALKEAAPENVTEVRRRWRRHRRGAAVAGLALGIIGAAVAAQHYDRYHRRHYRRNYYRPYGYYGPPRCIRRHGAVYCR